MGSTRLIVDVHIQVDSPCGIHVNQIDDHATKEDIDNELPGVILVQVRDDAGLERESFVD